LLSDGECNEGAVWEAALFAAHHHLDNLLVIIDANGLQGFGRTEEVLGLEPLVGKWKAFGFQCQEVDGHDFRSLHQALEVPSGGQPRCLVARTIKGKGVSLMEDKLEWHYLPMSEAQFAQALAELDEAERKLDLFP
jgi:transketolase